MRRPADPCRGGGSSLVPAAPSEGTPDVRVGRRRHGDIGRAEMWLPGRLARGLSPLADSSAHLVGDAFPRGRGGLFPPRLLLGSHPNGQCFTHVTSVTHTFWLSKPGDFYRRARRRLRRLAASAGPYVKSEIGRAHV